MIPFISRHIPTQAQAATVAERFGALTCTDPIVLSPGEVVEQVSDLVDASVAHRGARADGFGACATSHGEPCNCHPRIVAGVFPGWALLELLRSGWRVVEFVNQPAARARGVFVCRGAFVHSLNSSEWIACPLSAEDQAESPLLSGLR